MNASSAASRETESPDRAQAEEMDEVFANWEPSIRFLEERDRIAPPPASPILLIGSSTFTHWKTAAEDLRPWPILNRGFGGSDMLALLAFYERLVPPIRPRSIVLYIGGNDLNRGVVPDLFLERVRIFTERVYRDLPDAKMIVLSVQLKPCQPETDEIRRAINVRLAGYCASVDAEFVDITTPTLADGKPREDLFGPDRLHFNDAGYRVLAETILPVLKRVHGQPNAKQ